MTRPSGRHFAPSGLSETLQVTAQTVGFLTVTDPYIRAHHTGPCLRPPMNGATS